MTFGDEILQVLHMCRSAFHHNKWEILNIWARSWYYWKMADESWRLQQHWQLSNIPERNLFWSRSYPPCWHHPSPKKGWCICGSPNSFSEARTGDRVKNEQSPMGKGLQSESRDGSADYFRSFQDNFRMGIPWRFPFTSEQSNAEVVDPFMALSKLVRPFKIIESSPITSPWLWAKNCHYWRISKV